MRSKIRRSAGALAALPLLIAPLAFAAPAAAAPDTVTYDALGDSYAAGTGAADGYAFPDYLDGRKRIELEDFPAVSGASFATFASQLAVLNGDTDLVTLSLGGNDLPWVTSVAACLIFDDNACAGAMGAFVQGTAHPGFVPALGAAYTGVRTYAPNAHVVVTGYPHLFDPKFGDYTVNLDPATIQLLVPVLLELTDGNQNLVDAVIAQLQQNPVLHMSVAEQEMANAAVDALNAVIEQQAAAHGFQFVSLTWLFNNHGINARAPWINGIVLDPATFTSSLHPNAAGNRTIASELVGEIKTRDLR
nr:SGNH/GDSL hydrolase family protein [Actinomycetales bacterium]